MTTRVVLLREQLEDREVANFLPLAKRFDLTLLTLGSRGPYSASGLGLATQFAWSLSSAMPSPLMQRIASRTIGLRWNVERLKSLDKLVADAHVVIVNETHIASSAQVCDLRRRRQDLRVVTVCYENIPFQYEETERLARRKDLVRKWTDVFIALTPEAQAALLEEGVPPERVQLQPYGVDASRFSSSLRSSEVRRRWGADRDDSVVVLFTGRLLREKGLVELVRATALVADPRLRLVLVGDGPESGRIARAAASLGMTNLVREPWVDASAIPQLVASADVFALPSLPTPYWEEQLGFSAIEAMAAGLPVVGVSSGSIPFVVGDGGLLVPPYDVQLLAHAIQSLVDDSGLRRKVGLAGLRRVQDVLNTDTVAAGLGAILDGASAR